MLALKLLPFLNFVYATCLTRLDWAALIYTTSFVNLIFVFLFLFHVLTCCMNQICLVRV